MICEFSKASCYLEVWKRGKAIPNFVSIPVMIGMATWYPPMWYGLVGAASMAEDTCSSDPLGRLIQKFILFLFP